MISAHLFRQKRPLLPRPRIVNPGMFDPSTCPSLATDDLLRCRRIDHLDLFIAQVIESSDSAVGSGPPGGRGSHIRAFDSRERQHLCALDAPGAPIRFVFRLPRERMPCQESLMVSRTGARIDGRHVPPLRRKCLLALGAPVVRAHTAMIEIESARYRNARTPPFARLPPSAPDRGRTAQSSESPESTGSTVSLLPWCAPSSVG